MKFLFRKNLGTVLFVVLLVSICLLPQNSFSASDSGSIYTRLFVSGTTMVPGAPTDFVGVALSDSVISLSWLPSGTSTRSYNLYRSNIFLATIASSTYLDTGLSPLSTYTYQVIAYDKFQRESPPSEIISVTTLASGVVAPPPIPPPVSEPVRGCTDQLAINYNSNATVDNGTCRYLVPNLSDFTATKSGTGVRLAWTIPSFSRFSAVVITKSSVGVPASVTDGEIIYNGVGRFTIDNEISPGVTYYYLALVKNLDGDYSSGIVVSYKDGVVVPLPPPPPPPPPIPPVVPPSGGTTEIPHTGGGSVISRVITWTENITLPTTTEQLVKPILPVALAVSETVPVPVTVALAGASQLVTVAVSASSFTEIYLLILRQLGLLLEFFHIRKKRRPWGTVYDAVTKRPIDPAYVTVMREGKEVGTAITDIDGRYSFVLPDGRYSMIASKTHYLFPSKLLSGKTSDELYDNLYFGQEFEHSGDTVIELNIPIDPIKFDWNEYVKNKRNYFKTNFRLAIITSYVIGFLYTIGFVMALSYLIAEFSWLNFSIVSLYLLVFSWKTFYRSRHKVLHVVNTSNGESLAFAIIRVYMAEVDQLVKNVVADERGHFYLLVRPGTYYLTVDVKKNDGTYAQVYRSENQNLTNGVLTKDLKIFVAESVLK